MMISTPSNSLSPARMSINGRPVGGGVPGQGLTIKSSPGAGPGAAAATASNSLYDNFTKEMSKRLADNIKPTDEPEKDSNEAAVLAQSLTGAMGQIEQLFGRQAATEVMAKLLTGTAQGADEEALLGSLETGLAGLKRLDLTGVKMKRLTDGFNKDLTLALDPGQAAEKIEAGETISLSYALSQHFGLGGTAQKDSAAPLKNDPEGEQAALARPGALATEIFSPGQDSLNPDGTSERRRAPAETFGALGFDQTGRWEAVEMVKPADQTEKEVKEAAQAGLNKALEVDLAAIIDNDGGPKVFDGLAKYLKENLQDEESAAFVEEALNKAQETLIDQYGQSLGLTELLSQVYAKVAADGDTDKLVSLENYLNTDFKDSLNPVLAQMLPNFTGGATPELADLGAIEFKGITGAPAGGENDVFSLKWGYKEEETYDRSVNKHYLREDIRGVKEVKEKREETAESLKAKFRAVTMEAQIARQAKEASPNHKKTAPRPLVKRRQPTWTVSPKKNARLNWRRPSAPNSADWMKRP